MGCLRPPQFFSILLEHTLRDKKLQICKKFVKLKGEGLSDSVTLKVPCGSEWKIKLKKCDGEVWLEEGWQEFSEYYSLAVGSLLTFRYIEEASLFHVSIFGTSTYEIDYPILPKPEPTEDNDDFVETLKGFSEKVGQKNSEQTSTQHRASGFKCQNPIFNFVMHKSHLFDRYNTHLPIKFFKKHLNCQSGDDLTLQVSEGRIWPVKLRLGRLKERARFSENDWRKFAVENNLKIGDECIFELIDGKEKKFKVSFFRNGNVSQSRLSKAGKSSTSHIRPTKTVKFEEPFCDEPEVHNDHIEMVEGFSLSNKRRENSTSPSLRPEKRSRTSPVVQNEEVGQESAKQGRKPKVVRRVEKRASGFKSQNPFFKVLVHKSHLYDRYDSYLIRKKFWEKHLSSKSGHEVVLQVSDGRIWPTKIIWAKSRETTKEGFRRTDWTKFAQDNNLKVGDECIFELIEGKKLVFRVSIIRIDNESNSHPSKAGKSLTNQAECSSDEESDEIEVKTGNLSGKVTQKASSSRNSGALKVARQLSPTNPLFQIVIRENVAGLQVPNAFAKSYFVEEVPEISLEVGKQSWSVKLITNCNGYYYLSGGMTKFIRDNHLQAGDVCICELVSKNPVVLKVSILCS